MTQINNMQNMEEADTLIYAGLSIKISDERALAYREGSCEVFSILI